MAFLSSTALAEALVRGPDWLLSKSDLVLIVKLPESCKPGQVTTVRLLKTITGQAPSEFFSVFYPQPNMEEIWTHVPPKKGTVLLAFLKNYPDGTFVAATAVGRARSLVDGKEVEKEYFLPSSGNQCLKLIKDEGDVNRVAELFSQFLGWDQLDARRRSELLKASLTGPEIMRGIAFDWMMIDSKIDFEKHEEVSDEIVEGILANLHSPNPLLRQDARLAIYYALWSRKDLLPYCIDALDEPDALPWAVATLNGRLELFLDADKSPETRAAAIKDWWARTGSKKPDFRRFMPKPAPQPQPGASVRPGADGAAVTSGPGRSRIRMELTTTHPATQSATRPATTPTPSEPTEGGR